MENLDGMQMVVMRDGQSVSLQMPRRLWQIEERGVSFHIVEHGFDVGPPTKLTPEDQTFLNRHLDETIKIVELQEVDNGHLC